MDWLYGIVAIGGLAFGFIEKFTKLKWSNEYKALQEKQIMALEGELKAKESQIISLERHNQLLESLNPKYLIERYYALKELNEEYVKALKPQMKLYESKIMKLESEKSMQYDKIQDMKSKYKVLQAQYNELESAKNHNQPPDPNILWQSIVNSGYLSDSTSTPPLTEFERFKGHIIAQIECYDLIKKHETLLTGKTKDTKNDTEDE